MKYLTLAIFALAPLVLVGCGISRWFPAVSVSKDFQETLAVDSPVNVTAITNNGQIEIGATEHSEIEVQAHITANGATESVASEALESVVPVVEIVNGELRLDTTTWTKAPNVSVNLKLLVPAKFPVNLKSGNGAIAVSHRSGNIVASTSNGSIQVDDVEGESLELKTSNGSVTVDKGKGNLKATTSNGRIVLKNYQLSGSSKMKTSNGGIDLYLVADQPVQLQAKTGNGSIDCNVPVDNAEKKRHSFSGIAFGGKDVKDIPSLEMTTGNGGIDIQSATSN